MWRPLLLQQRAIQVEQQERRNRHGRTRRRRWQALLNIAKLQASLCCRIVYVSVTRLRSRAEPGLSVRLVVRGCGELLRKVHAPLPGHHGTAHVALQAVQGNKSALPLLLLAQGARNTAVSMSQVETVYRWSRHTCSCTRVQARVSKPAFLLCRASKISDVPAFLKLWEA